MTPLDTMTRHELNNLLAKILGSAELALDHSREPAVRTELACIVQLAQEAGRVVAGKKAPSAPGPED
jgi:hypothetical protein